MKILFVSPYFFPAIGGLENYVLHIIQGFQKAGHQCVVVTSLSQQGSLPLETVNGVKIYRLKPLFRLSNTPIHPLWFFSLQRIIEREQPDVINAHSPVPFIADSAFFARGKRKFLLTYHAGSILKGKGLIDALLGFYEKTILHHIFQKSDAVICTSAEFLQKKVTLLNAHAYLIQPGVDTQLFVPNPKITEDQKILYVGKVDTTAEWKGLNILLQSVKLLIDQHVLAQLTIVGDGNAIEKYRNLAERLGIAKVVTFTGPLSGQQLVKEYQSATVLVLPSLTEAESFGMVLIEALACKTPVIASRIGGIPYVIKENETGLLVPPNDPDKLARALIKVLKDKKLRSRLAQKGYELVTKKYSWASKHSKYIDISGKIA